MDSMEVSAGALLDELAAERAESAELRRALRALDAGHRLPQVEPSTLTSRPPKRGDWVKAGFAFLGALTLALGGLGTYLGARAAGQESTVAKVEAKTNAQTSVTTDLSPRVLELERQNRALLDWAREHEDYDRQVFRRLGVSIPQQVNAPPVTPIETRAPRHKPNTVTGAPVLEVLSPPPMLP